MQPLVLGKQVYRLHATCAYAFKTTLLNIIHLGGGWDGRCSREMLDAARVAREAFSALRCLLSIDASHALGTPPRRGGVGNMMARLDPGKQEDRPRNELASAVVNSHHVGPTLLVSDLLSPGSAIPQAVLGAVNDVLLWWCHGGPRDLERSPVTDVVCQVRPKTVVVLTVSRTGKRKQ